MMGHGSEALSLGAAAGFRMPLGAVAQVVVCIPWIRKSK